MRLPTPRDLPWSPVQAEASKRGLCMTDVGRMMGRATVTAARRHAHRCKHNGLTVWEADRIATRLGLHPSLLFGDSWWSAADGTEHLSEPERVLAAVRAGVRAAIREQERQDRERREWVRWLDDRRAHRCAYDGCGCGRVLVEVAA